MPILTYNITMKYSNKLIHARQIKRFEPMETFGARILDVILKNTPPFLHERILNKLNDITLDVKYDLSSSEFLEQTNTIMIKIDCINSMDVYLHEIMHAIGLEKTDDGYNIGLNKRCDFKLDNRKILRSNLGHGANEGLNQHYTESFLPLGTAFSDVVPCYSFCANIMATLEKLVGSDKCKDAHFSGKGLDALLNYMKEAFYLDNENKAIKFILALDAYMHVSKSHLIFGVTHTPDTRLLLTECYKSLIALALRKAKHENKEILFSDIITPDHLRTNNFTYFVKYLQSDLIKFFYTEKEYINSHTPSGFLGLRVKSMLEYCHLMYKHFCKYKNFDNITLPEEVKCGEFYNHMLLSCYIYDENDNVCPLDMSDFSRELTINIFSKNARFVPNKQSELVQMVKDILASRNVVRCGAEIDDDHIIESTKDVEFNLFLIDSSPETYKEILPFVDKNVLSNKEILTKIFNEVLSSNLEKIKFIKSLPDDLKQSDVVLEETNKIKNRLEKEYNPNI